MKRLVALTTFATALGCGSSTATVPRSRSVDATAFVGNWRSVTPSLEFARLSVHSMSSREGAIAARLTLSGVALEASDTPDADSVVASTSTVGGSASVGQLVLRV